MRYLVFSLILLGLSCTHAPAQGAKKLSPDAFESLISADSSLQLVDVRTPEEYREGYITGSKNLNFHAPDFAQRLSELDKNKPVLVYCAVGGRSGKAALQLREMGFEQVYDLEGGIKAWNAQSKALKK
jgi:rhodanese-related sulfurtransferase